AQYIPRQLLQPRFDGGAFQTLLLEVVEGEIELLRSQPGAGLFDGIAIGDTVECNGRHG
ncbi:hypothetical protein HZZ02_14965, partial [Streptococcus danieliae]|nr:hypothetical protein [Streptococcus danieliae]